MSEAAKKRRSFSMAYLLAQCAPPLKLPDKQPTAYSYNGVVLPKLPEWDKTVYPYAFISAVNSIADGLYALALCKNKPTWRDLTIRDYILYVLMDEESVCYECYMGERDFDFSKGVWGSIESGYYIASQKSTTTTGYWNVELIWANADTDSYDGTILTTATEPEPIYE